VDRVPLDNAFFLNGYIELVPTNGTTGYFPTLRPWPSTELRDLVLQQYAEETS
jgi:hypothetical protein